MQDILLLNACQVLPFLGPSMLAAEGLASRWTILIVKNKHLPLLKELYSRGNVVTTTPVGKSQVLMQ